MKKFLVLILSLVYLTSSVGATVHLHYCMDKLVGWDFVGSKGKACGKCGMEKKDAGKCCKDKPKHVKLQLDQKVPQTSTQLVFPVALPVAVLSFPDHTSLPSSIVISYPRSHAPPRSTGAPVYLRNRVFLI